MAWATEHGYVVVTADLDFGAILAATRRMSPSVVQVRSDILTPHSISWTDQCFRMMGESAVQSVLAVLRGEVPQHVVNRAVLERPGFRAKLEANRVRSQQLRGA